MLPLIEAGVCYHNNPFLQKKKKKEGISAVNMTPLPGPGSASFQGP